MVAAEKAGLVYGDMNIFHRLVEGHPELGPVFSVANMVKPGSFDMATIQSLETPAITFFMTLPAPVPALDAWETMLPTAQRMAELLDGVLLDEERNALGRQRIAHIRDELRAYDRSRGAPIRAVRAGARCAGADADRARCAAAGARSGCASRIPAMPSDGRNARRAARRIDDANHRYHVLDAPDITDAEYDALMRELEALEDAHPELATPTRRRRASARASGEFSEVVHARPMLSLSNAFSDEEVRDFVQRIVKATGDAEPEFSVEPKLDGLAISLRYEDGLFVRGAITPAAGARRAGAQSIGAAVFGELVDHASEDTGKGIGIGGGHNSRAQRGLRAGVQHARCEQPVAARHAAPLTVVIANTVGGDAVHEQFGRTERDPEAFARQRVDGSGRVTDQKHPPAVRPRTRCRSGPAAFRDFVVPRGAH